MMGLAAVFDGHFGHEANELAASTINLRFLIDVHSIIGELAACMNNLGKYPGRRTSLAMRRLLVDTQVVWKKRQSFKDLCC